MTWRDGPLAAQWIPVCNAAETVNVMPKNLLARQCFEESGFNPKASNPSGAVGIMQLLPEFFPGAGKNPVSDIQTAASYMVDLFKRFNDWQLALAAYDWGPTILEKAIKEPKFSILSLPTETQTYVTQIIKDVPVPGALCKTPSLPNSPLVGSPPSQPSAAASLEPPSHKSLWRSVTGMFSRPSTLPLQAPLPPSVLLAPSISSQVNQEVNSMSTPNPVLVAAKPAIINALKAVNQFAVDIGPNPAQWALLVPGALQKLLGTLEMQIPLVVTGEAGALQAAINAKVNELIAKVEAATGGAQVNPVPPPVTQ
jgi:hypothetical protein